MLKITHTKNASLTKKRKTILKAVKFFSEYLKLNCYDASIVIDFKFGLTDCFNEYASVEYNGVDTCTVLIDADIHNNLAIQIVAHEMVHVKQYFSGKLSWDNEGLQLWKNCHIEDGLKYTETPWEIDAMKNQIIMMYKFAEFQNSLV